MSMSQSNVLSKQGSEEALFKVDQLENEDDVDSDDEKFAKFDKASEKLFKAIDKASEQRQ